MIPACIWLSELESRSSLQQDWREIWLLRKSILKSVWNPAIADSLRPPTKIGHLGSRMRSSSPSLECHLVNFYGNLGNCSRSSASAPSAIEKRYFHNLGIADGISICSIFGPALLKKCLIVHVSSKILVSMAPFLCIILFMLPAALN